MNTEAVYRWLEHVKLRASQEPERKPSVPRGKGHVINIENGPGASFGSTCYVSVSKRTKSSPGAACEAYHERRRGELQREAQERDADVTHGELVEILRDNDISEWKGDRYSIVISPSDRDVDLVQLADRFLEQIEARFGAVRGSAWLHHDSIRRGNDHLHIAVDAQDGRILLTQRTTEKAVQAAVRAMERTKERGLSR